ncbi:MULTISPECIES: PP2C family protein-serine/threonine phosphatase [unclassified Paenibacillus]|uniref:PP2C family protein-serine/threonine phosphatase n=1 Tax=unclassified Paenibacillus TaxID=185978 RepID=UPI001AE71478|nr:MULTISPECIES: PP2C family protein-serine/threonine phosphatase [unclassified Paenibacillus]MBP1153983.1 serine phosphatase RsbU (regulator of sigma subunit) [Paenibacillus sp. PvP091]MBP1170632.1 serine phosphatase RsbU (regulator of sigma subunit) [Paenibacillus sp. PvR098]MBP2441660.1 serine phosphatase RsbU (regulator of sigma subunit) [Paenibacillus sp. PvP052]
MIRENKFQSLGEIGSTEMNKTLQREIHLARNIQTKLLNGGKLELPSGEVSGISIPARMIGGDYFDFYPLSDGKIRIIIGDVMGKGIPAAMLMILTRGAFRSAAEVTRGPGETLTAMNKALYKDLRTLGSFVTVFCADWDPIEGIFMYANAGHSLPVIIRASVGAIDPPDLKGVMLGGLPGQNYKEEKLRLQKDDLVFFYTDGIVEASNNQGQMFKIERLVQLLIEHGYKKASDIEQIVIDSINVFTEGLPQKDDITMVTLKVTAR